MLLTSANNDGTLQKRPMRVVQLIILADPHSSAFLPKADLLRVVMFSAGHSRIKIGQMFSHALSFYDKREWKSVPELQWPCLEGTARYVHRQMGWFYLVGFGTRPEEDG